MKNFDLFQTACVLSLDSSGFIKYTQGFCDCYLSKTELEYLIDKLELTLDFYNSIDLKDSDIKAHNKTLYLNEWELANNRVNQIIKEPKKPKEGYVYLAQNTVNGALKIGFSKNPKKRISQLNIASSEKIVLVTYFKDIINKEKELHHKFSKFNLNTEWFENVSLITDYFKKAKNEI